MNRNLITRGIKTIYGLRIGRRTIGGGTPEYNREFESQSALIPDLARARRHNILKKRLANKQLRKVALIKSQTVNT